MKLKNLFKTKKAKIIIGVIAVLFIIGFLSGNPKETKIEAVSLTSTIDTLDINDSQAFTFTIEPDNTKLSKENIILDDTGILKLVSIKGNTITLKTMSKTGTTSFYIQSDGINSNKVSINVVDKKKEEADLKAKQEAEEKAKQEEQAKAKQEEEAAKLAEEQKQAEEANRQAQANSQQSTPSAPNATTPNSATVYVTATGTKYHSRTNCGNSKTATAISLDQAISQGYGQCKNCF